MSAGCCMGVGDCAGDTGSEPGALTLAGLALVLSAISVAMASTSCSSESARVVTSTRIGDAELHSCLWACSAYCRELFRVCLCQYEIGTDRRFLELLKYRVRRVTEAMMPEHRRISDGGMGLDLGDFVV